MMKTVITAVLIFITGFSAYALDKPTQKDVDNIVRLIEILTNKTTGKNKEENKENSRSSKPVKPGRIYISREELEKIVDRAKEQGRTVGFKEGYSEGYKDGFNKAKDTSK